MIGQKSPGYESVSQSEESDHFSDSEDEENQYLPHKPVQQLTNQARALALLETKLAKTVAVIIIGIVVTVGFIWASNDEALPNPEVFESTFSPTSEITLAPSTNFEPTLTEDEEEEDSDDDDTTDEYGGMKRTVSPSFTDYLARTEFPRPGSAADRAENELDVERYFAWLTERQSPDDCETVQTESFWHQYGMGSILQTWKNTFIRSIARGRVLTSGFTNTYSNPNVCPTRQLEQCVVQPISTCMTKNPGANKKFFSSCYTQLPREKITKEARMSQVRSLGWFHAQSMRYLLRPRPSLTTLIEQVKSTLGLTDMRRVLSVHIRHGDLGGKNAGDRRDPINSYYYALMATATAYWDNFDVILVGSDDAGAFNIVKKIVTARVGKKITVIEFPTDIFEVLPNSDEEMASRFKQLHKKASPEDTTVQEKSEDAALLAEMFVMAESGGFIGSLNSNFGRTVYELAGGPESGRLLMDIEGRPYFGCAWTDKLPRGGGSQMYPFGH